MTPDPGHVSAAATLRAGLTRIGGTDGALVPFALGWATVDLDRAERSFRAVFAAFMGQAAISPDDTLLGARCRTLHVAVSNVPPIVLLEPFTEGRLAATLARHGEGPAVAWLRSAGPPGPMRRSGPADGPFGPEALLLGGPLAGPHRLLVLAEAGTISP